MSWCAILQHVNEDAKESTSQQQGQDAGNPVLYCDFTGTGTGAIFNVQLCQFNLIGFEKLLKINLGEDVAVVEVIDARLLPILLDVADSVTVSERIALRIGGGRRKRADLLTVGAGE